MHVNDKHGYFDNDRVCVQITDSKDGVFVTVDFKTLDDNNNSDTLGYRLWAFDNTTGVKVEAYEYYNQVKSVTTFSSHRLAN